MIGKTIGQLTVENFIGVDDKGRRRWTVRCTCGNTKNLATSDFNSKARYENPSCGCKQRDGLIERNTKHGLRKHPVYVAYHNMLSRCYNKSHPSYYRYGGRGITVCDRWLESAENFFEDMHPTYREGLSLERVDNDAGYSPKNCIWAEWKVNMRNRSCCHFLDTPWGRVTVAEAAEKSGIPYKTIQSRIRRGWSPEFLFRPSRKKAA